MRYFDSFNRGGTPQHEFMRHLKGYEDAYAPFVYGGLAFMLSKKNTDNAIYIAAWTIGAFAATLLFPHLLSTLIYIPTKIENAMYARVTDTSHHLFPTQESIAPYIDLIKPNVYDFGKPDTFLMADIEKAKKFITEKKMDKAYAEWSLKIFQQNIPGIFDSQPQIVIPFAINNGLNIK